MTFAELQNEVIMSRFDEHRRESVKMWINLRYAQVNAMTAWPWKYPSETTVTWEGDETFAELAPTVGKIQEVRVDGEDTNLVFMPFDEFSETFLTDTQSGTPTYWSVKAIGPSRLLYLAPLPGDSTLTLLTSARPPELSQDGDEPVWPPEYHYLLVLGALSTGLKVENDPTWEALELEYNTMVAAMKDDLLPANIPSNRQYGRDMLGYEWGATWP